MSCEPSKKSVIKHYKNRRFIIQHGILLNTHRPKLIADKHEKQRNILRYNHYHTLGFVVDVPIALQN